MGGIQAAWHTNHDHRPLFQPLDQLETDPAHPRVNPLQDHLSESISLPVEVEPRLIQPLDQQLACLSVTVTPLTNADYDVPTQRICQ